MSDSPIGSLASQRPPANFARRLAHLEAHHRFTISIVAGLLAMFLLGRNSSWPTHFIIGWDVYAATVLGLAWTQILRASPRTVVRLATLEHSSRIIIFLGVILAACMSFIAVAFLLGSAKDLPMAQKSGRVALAIATVVFSWIMVHTVFVLHYAYLYYRKQKGEDPSAGPRLLFPSEVCPDYYDFAYFSFVIGMTSQVSDVQVSSRIIRRWALLHGLISFAFNTAVLALSINIISGLL